MKKSSPKKRTIEITLDTPVEKLVETYPQAIGWLVQKGLTCVVCGEPFWGTLGELMERKAVANPNAVIKELNEWLNKAR